MNKVSKEELKKRKAELGKLARKELAKTEIMRFRLEPQNILKLCEIAEKQRQHVSSMVRQWVLERMETEADFSGTNKRTVKPPFVLGEKSILLRLHSLEAEVKRMSKQR